MEKLIYKVSKFSKIWVNVVIAVTYAILLALYQNRIEGLEKPAGFGEALTFLFKYPSDYAVALLIGIILHIVFIAMLALVILSLLGIWIGELRFEVPIGINIVLCVIIGILNLHYAQYVTSLVLVALFLFGIVWLYAQSER